MSGNKGVILSGDKKIEARLKRFLAKNQVVSGYDVGFIKSANYLIKTTKGETKKGPTVAEVAVRNEFGFPKGRIPERPYFRKANKKVEKPLIRFIDRNLTEKDAYVLSETDVKLMGQLHEGAVKESITALKAPPNKPSTIRQKGSSNPLIDTGQMRRSVISKVVK